jgi:hypothetical protein
MATINVATSQNLTAVTYATGDTINVNDGVTLTINSQWSIKPYMIQALGTGRVEVSNSSTTTLHLQEFYMQNGLNAGGLNITQNGVLQVRGDWITVGTSTGANNQTLFSANSVGGKAIDFPSEIEVETGNGTNVWEVWQAIPLDVTNGTVNTLGFNGDNATAGTVAVTAAGAVTGTGTNFALVNTGQFFKLPGITRDFVVGSYTSATSITIQELDGSTYTGGVIAAGTSYILRSGSLISATQVGSGDIGKVLFFNPLTTAVTMGDGTNGTKIPTGARVRVPNIHWNSAVQQTTLAAAITSTAAQAITLTAAIGPASSNAAAVTYVGTLLLVNGSTIERISYTTRSGTTVSATGQFRGVAGTTAQASFPIGTSVYWIPANNATIGNATFTTNVSGTVDMQVCSTGLKMCCTFNNYAALTLKNFGAYSLIVTSSAGTYSLDTISVTGGGYQAPGGSGAAISFTSMIGSGSFANIHANSNYSLNGSATGITFSNVQNAQAISNVRVRMYGRSASTSVNTRSIAFTTVKCATPIDGIYANFTIYTTALTNADIKNIYISSQPGSYSAGTSDGAVVLYITSTVNSTFRGIQIWDGGLAHRTYIALISADCESVVVHNKGYPAINGGSQLAAISNDAGLNSIIAWISVTSPRITTAQSYLTGMVTSNSGRLFRMLLIDSITATTSSTGGAMKGGTELDMLAGPHRFYATGATSAIVPNLVDVQPIVVLSNVAKTVGSVYVGPFSAQNDYAMYEFTGGTYLDNLGRIYYPSIGDSVIIKSVFALKGVTNFTGTAFDFNYNLGSGTNPIPAGTTVEFRMVNWGTANTGAWTTFTNNASLETARAALSGYSSSVGIDLQFRITGTTTVAARYVIGLKFPATIDAAYSPSVYSTNVGFSGAQTGTLIAGYLNASPSTPLLQGSATLTGSSGSIAMAYDYDANPVAYRLVARKPGWTFSSLTGTYLKSDITIPITQLQVVDTSSAPLYVSGVTGVAVNYNTSTITVSASRSAAQIWSAIQDDLSLLANLTKADPFTTSNGGIFYSTYTLLISGALTAGNIASNVTLTGSLSSGVVITGAVAQATPTDLTGVTINGPLTYNTNTNTTVTFTNCTVGTVSNTGTGTVTIRRVNTTLTAGTRVTAPLVTSLTISGLSSTCAIYVADSQGNQVDWVAAALAGSLSNNGVTIAGAAIGFVSGSGTYTLDTTGGANAPWTYEIAQYGKLATTGTHNPLTGSTTAAITFTTDPYITQASSNAVNAYTVIDTPEKAYDRGALYETTLDGIKLGSRITSKLAGAVSFGSYSLVFNPSASAAWTVSGSTVTLKATTFGAGSTFTDGLYTASTATINSGATVSSGLKCDGTLTNNGTVTGIVAASLLTNNGSIDNSTITCFQVDQTSNSNLTGVRLTGSIIYTSTVDSTVLFTNCAISDSLSSYADNLTVSLNNSTVGFTIFVTTRAYTFLNLAGLTAGSAIYVADDTGALVEYVSSSGTSYSRETSGSTGIWTWKVARYGYLAQSGTHSPAVATTTAAISLAVDPNFTQATAATVAAYTTLNTPDRIYDYAAYWETTQVGIPRARVASKAGSFCSVGSLNVTMATTGSVWAISGSTLTINTGSAWAPGTTMTSGLLTTGAITAGDTSGFTGLLSDSTGVRAPLTLAPAVSLAGAQVRVYDLDSAALGNLGTELEGTASCPASTYRIYRLAGNSIWVQILKDGYLEFGDTLTTPAAASTISPILQVDYNA